MDLKRFHLVFISCAIALAFLIGAWALGRSGLTGAPRLLAGIGSFAVGLALIAYEAWFLRYSKRAR